MLSTAPATTTTTASASATSITTTTTASSVATPVRTPIGVFKYTISWPDPDASVGDKITRSIVLGSQYSRTIGFKKFEGEINIYSGQNYNFESLATEIVRAFPPLRTMVNLRHGLFGHNDPGFRFEVRDSSLGVTPADIEKAKSKLYVIRKDFSEKFTKAINTSCLPFAWALRGTSSDAKEELKTSPSPTATSSSSSSSSCEESPNTAIEKAVLSGDLVAVNAALKRGADPVFAEKKAKDAEMKKVLKSDPSYAFWRVLHYFLDNIDRMLATMTGGKLLLLVATLALASDDITPALDQYVRLADFIELLHKLSHCSDDARIARVLSAHIAVNPIAKGLSLSNYVEYRNRLENLCTREGLHQFLCGLQHIYHSEISNNLHIRDYQKICRFIFNPMEIHLPSSVKDNGERGDFENNIPCQHALLACTKFQKTDFSDAIARLEVSLRAIPSRPRREEKSTAVSSSSSTASVARAVAASSSSSISSSSSSSSSSRPPKTASSTTSTYTGGVPTKRMVKKAPTTATTTTRLHDLSLHVDTQAGHTMVRSSTVRNGFNNL